MFNRKAQAQKAAAPAWYAEELKALEAARKEDGHKDRVDAFNAKLIAEMGKENCGMLIRGYQ